MCDIGATIYLIPLLFSKKFILRSPKPTMCLFMDDKTLKETIGVLQDVLVKVNHSFFYELCDSGL